MPSAFGQKSQEGFPGSPSSVEGMSLLLGLDADKKKEGGSAGITSEFCNCSDAQSTSVQKQLAEAIDAAAEELMSLLCN